MAPEGDDGCGLEKAESAAVGNPQEMLEVSQVAGETKPARGREAIVCPWHRYFITLDTGEGMYRDLDGSWRSKGPRQRTHRVFEEDNGVWIELMSGGDRQL